MGIDHSIDRLTSRVGSKVTRQRQRLSKHLDFTIFRVSHTNYNDINIGSDVIKVVMRIIH